MSDFSEHMPFMMLITPLGDVSHNRRKIEMTRDPCLIIQKISRGIMPTIVFHSFTYSGKHAS